MSESTTNQRKKDHIEIVLSKDVDDNLSVRDTYTLPYRALPESNLEEIDTSVQFFGKKLSFPFIISSMTGGPEKGQLINRHLAEAAEQAGVAIGLGSMRVIIEHPETLATFDVRKLCPTIPLFANVGLVQLNYGFGVDECNRIIDSIQADGLFFHINPLQEAVQPEGDTNFSNLLSKLEKLLPKLHAPVIVKETGNGIDAKTAQRLADIGIERIDVSGRGGTSWPAVEGVRRGNRLGETVRKLGISTDQSLLACKDIPGLKLIAGGGVRSGIDVAKTLFLGAKLGTAASPFLKPALESSEAVYEELMIWKKEFQIAKRVS